MAMDIDEMLQRLHDGDELLSQSFDGKTEWWFRTFSDAGKIDVRVDSDDVKSLIESEFVVQNELETDGEGTWFTGYEINDAGREHMKKIAVARALEILDRVPDAPPDPGDELPETSVK